MSTVKIGDMETEISKLLQGYADEIADGMKQDAKDVAKEAVSELKSTSPTGKGSKKGHYKSGWKSVSDESNGSISIVIHNSKKPSLTHLLEAGHEIIHPKTGKSYGHSKKFEHITPAAEKAVAEFEKCLKKRISQ